RKCEMLRNVNELTKFTKLKILYLQNSRITNLDALKNLTNLTTLNLKDSKFISYVDGLANLTNLTDLNLSYCYKLCYYISNHKSNAIGKFTNLIKLDLFYSYE